MVQAGRWQRLSWLSSTFEYFPMTQAKRAKGYFRKAVKSKPFNGRVQKDDNRDLNKRVAVSN
jgi:Tfp pilus assembly protein PilF